MNGWRRAAAVVKSLRPTYIMLAGRRRRTARLGVIPRKSGIILRDPSLAGKKDGFANT